MAPNTPAPEAMSEGVYIGPIDMYTDPQAEAVADLIYREILASEYASEKHLEFVLRGIGNTKNPQWLGLRGEDGAVQSFVHFYPLGLSNVHVKYLGTFPEFRGCGNAPRLLERVGTIACADGFETVSLRPVGTPAEYYEGLGFKRPNNEFLWKKLAAPA
jgi:GNAT superfamily N-acetyltransferase